jgi:hypothetical protein
MQAHFGGTSGRSLAGFTTDAPNDGVYRRYGKRLTTVPGICPGYTWQMTRLGPGRNVAIHYPDARLTASASLNIQVSDRPGPATIRSDR